MFLSTFLSRMTIVYRAEAAHLNVDELSRMITKSNNFSSKTQLATISLSVLIIKDNSEFLTQVTNNLSTDEVFQKIYKHLQQQIKKTKDDEEEINTQYQSYRMNSNIDFLYLIARSKSNKLCISKNLQKKILKYAHDKHAHEEVHRTYDLLRKSVTMSKIKKLVYKYVTFCSFCQFSKLSRQLSCEELQLIDFSSKLFSKISIDFIVILLVTSEDYNALMTITNRFSKFILLISENEILFAVE
jgi:phosphopantetheine adenylyltransferase